MEKMDPKTHAIMLRGEAVRLLADARETAKNAQKVADDARGNVDKLVKILAELDKVIGPNA